MKTTVAQKLQKIQGTELETYDIPCEIKELFDYLLENSVITSATLFVLGCKHQTDFKTILTELTECIYCSRHCIPGNIIETATNMSNYCLKMLDTNG